MQDEYGRMDSSGETYVYKNSSGLFKLDNGQVLHKPQVRYRTFGTMNTERNNAMVVCHALTGNASLDSWWGDMLGSGKLFDTDQYFVICANILGSCYGTCGPTEINPETGEPYGTSFPDVTIRDSVRLHLAMVQHGLGVKQIAVVVGGSLGGMQVSY